MWNFILPPLRGLGKLVGEGGRFAIQHVLALVGGQSGINEQLYLVATNGVALGCLPMDRHSGLPERPTLLPAQALTASARPTSVLVDTETCRVSRTKGEEELPLPKQEGRFPNFKAILPSPEKVAGYTHVALDTTLLSLLAKSLSSTGLAHLFLPPPKSGEVAEPVLVLGYGPLERGLGLLMPFAPRGNQEGDVDAQALQEAYATHYGRLPNTGFDLTVPEPEKVEEVVV